jgi:hypothetical protein
MLRDNTKFRMKSLKMPWTCIISIVCLHKSLFQVFQACLSNEKLFFWGLCVKMKMASLSWRKSSGAADGAPCDAYIPARFDMRHNGHRKKSCRRKRKKLRKCVACVCRASNIIPSKSIHIEKFFFCYTNTNEEILGFNVSRILTNIACLCAELQHM